MRLTVIADDSTVGVDGVMLDGVNLSQLDPTVHAVQWYGEFGEVEFKTTFAAGAIVKPDNQVITSMAEFQFAVDAFNARKAELEAAAQAAANQPAVTGAQTL